MASDATLPSGSREASGNPVRHASVLSAWSNFYIIVGSSAASLTGLMFVVVTLTRERTRVSEEGVSSYSTPTVLHFCAALFVATVLSAPWQRFGFLGGMLFLSGAAGASYIIRIILRTSRHTVYRPDLEDRIWYMALPLIAYGTIAIAGALFVTSGLYGSQFALAGAALLLIFVGIHNAWDLVTFIAIREVEDDDQPGDSGNDAENAAAK